MKLTKNSIIIGALCVFGLIAASTVDMWQAPHHDSTMIGVGTDDEPLGVNCGDLRSDSIVMHTDDDITISAGGDLWLHGNNVHIDNGGELYISNEMDRNDSPDDILGYDETTRHVFKTAMPSGGGSASYLVYTALLTQSGTDAPVATVLENTIGTITYGYISDGSFTILSSGLFTEGKTFFTCSPAADPADFLTYMWASAGVLDLGTGILNLDDGVFQSANGRLAGGRIIKIEVYP